MQRLIHIIAKANFAKWFSLASQKAPRTTAMIVPGLLLILLVLSFQLGRQQSTIDTQVSVIEALKNQTNSSAQISLFKDTVLNLNPLIELPTSEDEAYTAQIQFAGGLYNLSHALDWDGQSISARIDDRQIPTVSRVMIACGLSGDLVMPLLVQARKFPVSDTPRDLLMLSDGDKLSEATLDKMKTCFEMRPFLAYFELLRAPAFIGAAVLGVDIASFNQIQSDIRSGKIQNRSALKVEMERRHNDTNKHIDYKTLALALTPKWWTIELRKSDLAFAKFTIYQRSDRNREIAAYQLYWMPNISEVNL